MREQLVVGEAPAEDGERLQVGLRARIVQLDQGLSPRRELLAGEEGRVEPFGQLGRAFQRLQGQLADHPRGEARGGRIDRLDLRDLRGAFERDHVVRMGHLQFAAEPLDLARDHALGADGMLALQVGAAALEEHQGQETRPVEGADAPGQVLARRGDMGLDFHLQGLHLALAGVGGRRHGALDHALGRQEQHVAHERPGQLQDQGLDLGPDALEGGDGREQRKQNLRAHERDCRGPGLRREADWLRVQGKRRAEAASGLPAGRPRSDRDAWSGRP